MWFVFPHVCVSVSVCVLQMSCYCAKAIHEVVSQRTPVYIWMAVYGVYLIKETF